MGIAWATDWAQQHPDAVNESGYACATDGVDQVVVQSVINSLSRRLAADRSTREHDACHANRHREQVRGIERHRSPPGTPLRNTRLQLCQQNRIQMTEPSHAGIPPIGVDDGGIDADLLVNGSVRTNP
ncbi:hypothetical protein N3K63_03260 [Microbacterium sp. W1N]|uniref:hypothetical protein n=1 Tax=Microbacterium festucae TaxID=2977531 RepID=UPI0021C0FBB8|nr:hypothetical protein [Microbacterium festucae]MCT9819300.1 hypothetical protein [Microbacterium festucae]